MLTKKRIAAWLLTLIMLLQVMPFDAVAEGIAASGTGETVTETTDIATGDETATDEGEASETQEDVSNTVEGLIYHTVTFISDGSVLEQRVYEDGTALGETPVASKAGNEFLGWKYFDGAQTKCYLLSCRLFLV